jgi:hypothetical protein
MERYVALLIGYRAATDSRRSQPMPSCVPISFCRRRCLRDLQKQVLYDIYESARSNQHGGTPKSGEKPSILEERVRRLRRSRRQSEFASRHCLSRRLPSSSALDLPSNNLLPAARRFSRLNEAGLSIPDGHNINQASRTLSVPGQGSRSVSSSEVTERGDVSPAQPNSASRLGSPPTSALGRDPT